MQEGLGQHLSHVLSTNIRPVVLFTMLWKYRSMQVTVSENDIASGSHGRSEIYGAPTTWRHYYQPQWQYITKVKIKVCCLDLYGILSQLISWLTITPNLRKHSVWTPLHRPANLARSLSSTAYSWPNSCASSFTGNETKQDCGTVVSRIPNR